MRDVREDCCCLVPSSSKLLCNIRVKNILGNNFVAWLLEWKAHCDKKQSALQILPQSCSELVPWKKDMDLVDISGYCSLFLLTLAANVFFNIMLVLVGDAEVNCRQSTIGKHVPFNGGYRCLLHLLWYSTCRHHTVSCQHLKLWLQDKHEGKALKNVYLIVLKTLPCMCGPLLRKTSGRNLTNAQMLQLTSIESKNVQVIDWYMLQLSMIWKTKTC